MGAAACEGADLASSSSLFLRMLQERISDRDAVVLKHLVDVTGSRVCPDGDRNCSHGFVLKFFFTPNDFFMEDQLSIQVAFADEEESVVKCIQGTSISWTSHGMCFLFIFMLSGNVATINV